MLKRSLKSSQGADHGADFHAHDSVLSQDCENLCVDTSNTEELANDPTIILEAVSRDQRRAGEVASRDSVIEELRCVSVASSANDCRDSEA